MKLVHEGTGIEVRVGDIVTDFRGETAVVTSWERPSHGGSTGRLYVKTERGHTQGYYPSVYDCKWIEREDQD